MLDQAHGREVPLMTGMAIGLAVSSKYSALPIVLAPAMAGLYIAKDRANTQGGISSAIRLLSYCGH